MMDGLETTSRRFALIGAAGYVAPRHMKAIKETGNQLIAAYDPFDSVGILDKYFPEADFFVEFERFDRHIEKLRRQGIQTDYLSVCSPNYLHDAHCRFGMRTGADVICEKPVVLNPWNIDALQEIEYETGKKIYSILQLRLHPEVLALKKMVDEAPDDKVFDVDLTYLTSRGRWYHTSWKGDGTKSGGIATNIGVHFFDMLIWIFGEVKESRVHLQNHDRASGYLVLNQARVRWFLSINPAVISSTDPRKKGPTWRSLQIDGEEYEFSGGFDQLHERSYKYILTGKGFGLEDTRPSIQLVHDIRITAPTGIDDVAHPLARLPVVPHPFGIE